MVTNFSTKGGVVTRGETFTKLLHHLREAQDQAAVLGHLHQTENTEADKLRAHGWLGISELIARMITQVTKLAIRGLQ